MNLVSLLIFILVLLLIFGLIEIIVSQVPLFAPYHGWIRAVLALLLIIVLIGALFGGVNIPTLRIS